jgi:hypothetical protein
VELTRSEFAREGMKNVSFMVFDLLKDRADIPFKNEIDVVVAAHVLEHFNDKELNKAIISIKTMLKKKGAFIGATPYKASYNIRICPDCGYKFEIDGHKQIFDRNSIIEKIGREDFISLLVRNFNWEYETRNCGFFRKLLKKMNWEFFGYPQGGQLEFIFQKK